MALMQTPEAFGPSLAAAGIGGVGSINTFSRSFPVLSAFVVASLSCCEPVGSLVMKLLAVPVAVVPKPTG